MPTKLRFAFEKYNQPFTILKIWDQVHQNPTDLDLIRDAEPVMTVQILDILNHPPNKIQAKEVALLQNIDRLSVELQALISIPRHAEQLRKMKKWAEDFITSTNKERCIYVAQHSERNQSGVIY